VTVNPEQFKFLYQQHENTHDINMLDNDGYSRGWMQWDDDTGELQHIRVNESHRRRGLATNMWGRAQRLADERGITAPVHSAERTKDGDAWAKSLGEKLPRRRAVHYGFGRVGEEVPYDKYETLPD
jgi:ribosomal protein S18 acetylase RimI-like enzyme